ncbi:MAG: DUF3450 domain-containing protein [Lentisphaerae bacterium]|nr:DUF3450 domain-containing protein [Lentisphaerota bacterium]
MVLPLFHAAPTRAEDTNALPSLEGLVRQWVDLRTQTASESRAAVEQEQHLRTEIDILERERASLQSQRDDLDRQQQARAADLNAQSARQAQLKATLDGLRPAVERAEADLRRWQPRIPEPLSGPVAADFQQLSSSAARPGDEPLAQRLMVALALYTRIEALQGSMNVVKQILTDGQGGRREMEVLYLGLARGFAVSPDDQWAAVGVPAADGWHWEARPALAEAIRRAIELQQRGHPAALSPLPLQVVEVAP